MDFADGTPGIAKLAAAEAAAVRVGQAVSVAWERTRQHLIHERAAI
jgi:hypothetical protein